MRIKKIGVVTGPPYETSYKNNILLIDADDNKYYCVDNSGIFYYVGGSLEGYRQATQDEIEANWEHIVKHWQPQYGDQVVVTESGYEGSGVILSVYPDNDSYWSVAKKYGNVTPFMKEHMMLSCEQGWSITVVKPEEPLPKYHLEVVDELRKLDLGLVDLINSRLDQDVSEHASLADVVTDGFTWGGSLEGFNFWDKIHGFLTLKNYSKANQYYNEYIQQIKQATEPETKTVVSNFEIGETVLVNESSMDAYKATIVGMSPLHVEIEVDLKDYPLKIKIDSHVLRKYVQHSCIAKFPVESINLEDSVPKKEPSSDLKFKLGDRVVVTEGVGKDKTGVITKLPSKDLMYFVVLDTSESLWKYPQNIKLVSEEERAQRIDLELLRSKFPIGSKVMITKGVHKDCFGTVKHHKIGYVDGPLVGVEVNKYISGTNLDGTIDSTNGWYVTENELVHSSWYSTPESPSEVLSIFQPKKESKVSDYQQNPVTLYKPKTKLSLKPIKL